MSNFAVLHKLLKKDSTKNALKSSAKVEKADKLEGQSDVDGKDKLSKVSTQGTSLSLKSDLVKHLSSVYNQKLTENSNLEREFLFLCMYYGIIEPAMTLDAIGQAQTKNCLTRERVRQIIDSVVPFVKSKNDSPYSRANTLISNKLQEIDSKFLRLEQLFSISYFDSFKNNTKGLISFLNDCGIKQIAYRKEYYFYLAQNSREDVIKSIQKQNKEIRKSQTIENMAKKSKTVTYVPKEIKEFLNQTSKEQSIGLNELYENIFKSFIAHNPYEQLAYIFPKTKSWRARKGTAEWEQIGIYIEKELFDEIKHIVKRLKKNKKSVSFMSFFCQSFIWFHKNQVPDA